MTYKTITIEQHENLAVLFLNRPEKLNAFTFLMMEELISAFDAIEADDNLKAVIISGAGRAFCAGADLSSGKDTFNPSFDNFAVKEDDFRRDSGGILTLRMYKFLKPIIFACNGPAVGIGASMQLPGDIRIASEDARFGFVFNNRGIVPDACSSWFLPKIVGISKALDLTFSGRIIESKEALDISLISSIHKPENLIDDAIKIAQELTEKSAPISIAITRQMLWRSFGQSDPYDAHVIESKAIDSRGASDDAKEGVNSFLEKRPAKFKNIISSDMPDFFSMVGRLEIMNDLTWKEFERVDVRVGTILSAEEFKEAIKPAIKMTIDFGEEIGIKKSSAQITDHYNPQSLVGMQVAAVINFPKKQIGPFMSECLVTGFTQSDGSIILAVPHKGALNGSRLA